MCNLKNNKIFVVFDVNTHEIIYYSNNVSECMSYLENQSNKDELDWGPINLKTVLDLIFNK